MSLIKKLQGKQLPTIAALTVVVLASSAAYGQGLSGGGQANTIVTKIGQMEWLKSLITAGFAMAAMLQIFERWKAIFEGQDVLKHLAVIGAYVALTIWWYDILKNVVNPG